MENKRIPINYSTSKENCTEIKIEKQANMSATASLLLDRNNDY